MCLKNCDPCDAFEIIGDNDPKPIYLKLKDADFFKVFTIGQIFEIFNKYPKASYILNGGNTGNGNANKLTIKENVLFNLLIYQ